MVYSLWCLPEVFWRSWSEIERQKNSYKNQNLTYPWVPRAKYCKRALKSFNLSGFSGNVRYSGHCLPSAWIANSKHSTCENRIEGPSVISTSVGGGGMYSSNTLKIASILSFGFSRVPQCVTSSAKTFKRRSWVWGWSSAAPIRCQVESGKNLSHMNFTKGVASICDEK